MKPALLALLLAAAVCAVYSNHFANEFHFDDSHTIQSNAAIRSLDNPARFFTDARTFSTLPDHQEYRPLVTASLALDYRLGGGLKPFWFHASTFLWFLVQLALMAWLFRAVMDAAAPSPSNAYAALLGAALFGLHPAAAETVNYIVQRADLYAALGVVAGLALYVRGSRFYLLPVVVAALAKPSALVFAPILAVYIFLFEEEAQWSSWRRIAQRVAPAFAVSAFAFFFTRAMTAPTASLGGASFWFYVGAQPAALVYYVTQFFAPLQLCADTGSQALSFSADSAFVFGLALLALLALAAWQCARMRATRPIAFGIAWFLLALAPASLAPLAETRNDHRMFLPFAGLALAAVWSMRLLTRDRVPARVAAGAAALVLVCFGALTWQRNEVWRSEETLWRDVVDKAPRNGRGLMNYALTQSARGDYRAALGYLEQARQYTPNYPLLHINLGVVHGELGNNAAAEWHFQRALALSPGEAQAEYYFARWLAAKGRNGEAARLLDDAALHNPTWEAPRLLLARIGAQENTPERLIDTSLAFYRAGRYAESIDAARRALALRPGYPEAYNNIAAGYASMGEWEQAIEAAQTALRLRPSYTLARNNLAWAMSQRGTRGQATLVAARQR